jgi:hypothetical protein
VPVSVSNDVNRHNCRIRESEQPNEIHEYIHRSAKVDVWCGLLCDRVVCPFFFTVSTITGDIYLQLLQLYVCPHIEDVERETGNRAIFMQDGAPPNVSLPVRGALNEKFPNAWIGRGGPIPWPPRSPDLTPMDFFFCRDTSRTVCMVKRFGISSTYGTGSQRQLQT